MYFTRVCTHEAKIFYDYFNYSYLIALLEYLLQVSFCHCYASRDQNNFFFNSVLAFCFIHV